MRLALVIVCLSQLACLRREAPTRLAEATPIAVVILHESASEPVLLPVPEQLSARLDERLAERNLVPVAMDAAPVAKAGRASGQRMAALTAGTQAKLALLVEVKATFYEVLQGRFRWVVSAKITAQRRGDQASEASESVDLPVFLLYHHEREQEALQAAAEGISLRALKLVDGFVSAHAAAGAPVP